MPSAAPARSSTLSLLAADRQAGLALQPADVVAVDRCRRGAVARSGPGGTVRRAHPGARGTLVLEARPEAAGLRLEVWGKAGDRTGEAEAALLRLRAWVGLDDDVTGFDDVVAGHALLARLQRELGSPRLSRLPTVGEAAGRAIIAQLVQSVEARRSTAALVARAGAAGTHGLWCWPAPARIRGLQTWALRPCGISLRGARALHATAAVDRRLEEAGRDWVVLDRRLRALPGVGPWTSAETRLALGDPDAVSVGDYNLPSVVGHVLGGGPTDDAGMLALLAPFAGHRARVVRLVLLALRARRVAPLRRRAPRAALSAHRSW